MNTNLPDEFIKQITQKLGSETSRFLASFDEVPPTSIRINPSKKSEVVKGLSISYCKYGYILDQRPSFSEDPCFHAGAYYVQEASSMILAYILEQIVPSSNDSEPLKILDLCASPGGKTTLISDFVAKSSLIIANEVIKPRSIVLKENVMKWGRSNIVVTNNDPLQFDGMKGYFDLIIIDAPCSGEGMFRKDPGAIDEWSYDNVKICSARQNRIVHDVYQALKPNGKIVYSTCTFNDTENIDVIQNMMDSYQMTSVDIDSPDQFGLTEIKKNNAIGYHLFPHKVEGEGLFIAILQNHGENLPRRDALTLKNAKKYLKGLDKSQNLILRSWIKENELDYCMIHDNGDVYHYNSALFSEINTILANLKVVYSGVKCGNLSKSLFIPDHALALSSIVHNDIPRKELTLIEAQNYLRRKLDSLDCDRTSWHIATYKNLQLGWFKNLGNRINNYYPMEYRLRK